MVEFYILIFFNFFPHFLQDNGVTKSSESKILKINYKLDIDEWEKN